MQESSGGKGLRSSLSITVPLRARHYSYYSPLRKNSAEIWACHRRVAGILLGQKKQERFSIKLPIGCRLTLEACLNQEAVQRLLSPNGLGYSLSMADRCYSRTRTF